MTLSTPILAALVGLLLGIANFIGFRAMIAQLRQTRPPDEIRNRARALAAIGWFDLIAFPVVGYFIPTIFRGL